MLLLYSLLKHKHRNIMKKSILTIAFLLTISALSFGQTAGERLDKGVDKTKEAAKNTAQATKRAGKKVGEETKEAAQDVGDASKKAVNATKRTSKKVARKAKRTVNRTASKVEDKTDN
jgi:gas vesicle protein